MLLTLALIPFALAGLLIFLSVICVIFFFVLLIIGKMLGK